MKLIRIFVLTAAIILCLTACNVKTSSEDHPEESAGPHASPITTIDTPVHTPTKVKTIPNTEREIPMLLAAEDAVSGTIQVHHTFWDTENGKFSEMEAWYTLRDDQGLWNEKTYWWNGSTRVVTYGDPDTILDGLDVKKFDYMSMGSRGSVEFVSGSPSGADSEEFPYLQYTDRNGEVYSFEYPRLTVPEDLTSDAVMTEIPFYVGQFDDTTLIVFMTYHNEAMDGDMYYAKCRSTASDDDIQWGHAYIPWEYAVDVYMNGNVFSDGIFLYMAAWDEVLIVDLNTDTVNTLKSLDKFLEQHPNFGNEEGMSDTPVPVMDPISIDGFWDETCIVHYDFWDKDGTEHLYYLAIRDDCILGIMERSNGVFTFYDEQLNELGQNADFEGILKNSGCIFATQ